MGIAGDRLKRPSSPSVPTHVAIVMDGNGRWARNHGLSRIEGHRAGTENVRQVTETLAEHGVKHLTLFAFSTENWNRSSSEVRGLFRVLAEAIDSETQSLHEKGAKLCHLGRLDRLPKRLQDKVREAIKLTDKNTRITLNIAFDYGGRDDIISAVSRIVQEGISPPAIDENLFAQHLYTAGLPDPDLIIRTGGEMRISNFLIWQSAYSELYFTDVLWPDFNKDEVEKALGSYSKRERRFGRRVGGGRRSRGQDGG